MVLYNNQAGPGSQYNYNGPNQYISQGRDQNVNQNFFGAEMDSRQILWDVIKNVGASHSAEQQASRGECLEGTREEVLRIIHGWRVPNSWTPPICWLYGAAGVGKSSIAITVAKSCEDDGLVASFFFFRFDPRRDNPAALILTIAQGLAATNPSIRQILDKKITEDRPILRAQLERQFEELVLKPIRAQALPSSGAPNLVVIDGLDECSDEPTQLRVLDTIASAYRHHSPKSPPIPLRFLICSRPEVWLRQMFEGPRFEGLVKSIPLDKMFQPIKDIRRFYEHEFQEIRRSMEYLDVALPDPWPSERDFNLLMSKTGEHFSYAATAVRFVKLPYCNPVNQLDIILVGDTASNSPFREIDRLYHIILSANPHHNVTLSILAAILILPPYLDNQYDDDNDVPYFGFRRKPLPRTHPNLTPEFIELLLGFSPGEVALMLRGMHSVLDIRGRKDGIHVYHTSFTDYLRDHARSGDFHVDENAQHCFLSRRWLQVLSIKKIEGYR